MSVEKEGNADGNRASGRGSARAS